MAASDTPGVLIDRDIEQVSLDCRGSFGGSVRLSEIAAPPAGSTIAGSGIIWMENTTPCRVAFTDDTGASSVLALAPASATTDNAVARFNGTAGAIENSTLILNDAGELALTSTGTTTDALTVTANALTTGRGAVIQSSSGDASIRQLLRVVNSNATAAGTTLVSLDQSANQRAIAITSLGATTADLISVIASAVTTGNGMNIIVPALTTGSGLRIESASATVNSRNILDVASTNAAATGATTAAFTNASTGRVLSLSGGTTAASMLNIAANALTTGNGLRVSSTSADISTRSLAIIDVGSPAAVGTTGLQIIQSADQVSMNLSGVGGGSIQFTEIAAVPGGAPAAGTGKIWVDSTPATNRPRFTDEDGVTRYIDMGYTLSYGGNVNGTPRTLDVNGLADTGLSTTLDWLTEACAPRAGNLRTLTWSTQAATATTQIEVISNAVVVATVTLTGLNGAIAITGSPAVVAGDRIALRWNGGGTRPDRGNYNILVD